MTLQTRKPTGKPAWPILLIAGAEKAGKSWACAAASGSDLIGRTLWVGVGEDDPDEYGAVPGARFEIVDHDGTYRGILRALTDAAAEKGDKPNLIVLDSATRLWDLLSDMGQAEANQRAVEKARKQNRPAPKEEARIDMDLWNLAKSRWQHILDTLRSHQGPSIVTARLETVTAMEDGQPVKGSGGKVLSVTKIKAEKGLAYDVGAIVELPERGKAYLTGVRSVRLAAQSEARRELKNFTVDKLWRDLGLAEKDATTAREFHSSDGQQSVDAEEELVAHRQRLLGKLRELANPTEVAAHWQKTHGHKISETTDLDSLAALVATYEGAKEKAA